MKKGKRILIVGGVAAGASCAARARRLCEHSEIIMFDRGPYVSFANCGLPYYVGEVIKEEEDLLVASVELFRERFNIEVRTQSEVVRIDRQKREIEVKDLRSGSVYREGYDALVLAPGAKPLKPPLEGIDLPGIFVLRSIPDSRRIRDWILATDARRAVVVGGGFIGIEMAENLVRRGLNVSLIEMAPQVLPPLDPEMASPVQAHLFSSGVSLRLGDGVQAFRKQEAGHLIVSTTQGHTLPADIVILAIGVRPETALAERAGIEVGERGGIRVDHAMRTSDPFVWAVGDAVEVKDYVTGAWGVVPLAGPANRQGRLAADSICGREVEFRGVQGTAVCSLFGLTVALTGASEKALRRAGIANYEKVYIHPGHHAGYYPGARPIHLKLIFSRAGGLILGAQAVGEEGVEKRIDVISMAIQKRATAFDLEEAELCYAPQFGAAKDPVNIAGMTAANVLRGDVSLASWESLSCAEPFLLDVREAAEFTSGHVEGAVNIPLSELRKRMDELPRDREVWVYCGVGQRAYYAARALSQWGFNVRNLSGGYRTYGHFGCLLNKEEGK